MSDFYCTACNLYFEHYFSKEPDECPGCRTTDAIELAARCEACQDYYPVGIIEEGLCPECEEALT